MSPAPRSRRAPDRGRGLRSLHGQLLTLLAVKGAMVVAAMGVLVLFALQANASTVRARHLAVAQTDVARAVTAMADEDAAVRGYLLTGDDRQLAPLADHVVTDRLAALRADLIGVGEPTAAVDTLAAAHRRWRADVVDAEVAAVRAGGRDAAVHQETATAGGGSLVALRADADAVGAVVDAARTRAVTGATAARSRVVWLVVGVLVMLVGALAVATVILRRAVIAPLRRLRCAARRVAGGAWDQGVPAAGPTEIAELAADVERMRAALVEHAAQERRSAEALHQQGPAVVALRRALEPSPWGQPGFDVAGRLDPAEGILAGDWYDVVALDADRVGVVVGDVAGHGAGSGVYAMRLKNLLRASLLSGRGPAQVIEGLARHIAAYPDDERVASGELFATVFVGVVDRRDGMLTYASAGHLDAVVLRPASIPGNGSGAALRRDLPSTGPMLSALLAGHRWREDVRLFQPDDVLVVTTDGVLEARRPDDDEFGADRLVHAVGPTLGRGEAMTTAVDAVFDALGGFEIRARDDRTLVLLRITDTPTRFATARLGAGDGVPVAAVSER